jgi:formylmethanofuran dehydrogenase subunit E
MLGCNHRNVVCNLHSENMPIFNFGIYLAVKCAKCGELFRELATRLELAQSPACSSRARESG